MGEGEILDVCRAWMRKACERGRNPRGFVGGEWEKPVRINSSALKIENRSASESSLSYRSHGTY